MTLEGEYYQKARKGGGFSNVAILMTLEGEYYYDSKLAISQQAVWSQSS